MSSKASTPPAENSPREGQSVPPPARIPAVGEGTFQKGRVVWGRPPQVTFRAGPLPRDEGLARLMAMPPHPQPPRAQSATPRVTGSAAAGAGMGGFSNVPSPKPSVSESKGAVPQANDSGIFGNTLVPPPPTKPKASEPVTTAPAAASPVVAGPVATAVPEGGDVLNAPVVSSPEPVIAAAPSPVKGNRGIGTWVAVGAIALAAGAAALVWLNREPATVTETPAPPVTAREETATAPVELPAGAPVEAPGDAPAEADVAATSTPPVAARPAPAAPARATTAPAREAAARPRPVPAEPARTTAPVAQTRPAPQSTAPVVVVTPPVEAVTLPVVQGAPPTAARPPETDPNAPVVTRPARLD